MTRRKFLKAILIGGIFTIFFRKMNTENKSDERLKVAMFWRRIDS